jgi:hypothetical protein
MLNPRQTRQLAEIADAIASEDPALARALSRHRVQGRDAARGRWWRFAVAALVVVVVMGVGLALLAVGLHTGDTAPTAAGAVVVALVPLVQMLLLQRR